MSKGTFLFLLAACFAVYIAGSILIPLMDIDASQYASISREMLERSSYLQIYDQGKDYLDKPPMLFWLSALSMKIIGVYDWSYRIPSLLFLGIAVAATYGFAKQHYSIQVARLAALILASSQALFLIAHDVRTDTMLMGWVMASIYLLSKWESSSKSIDFFFAIIAIAGGMMTKGPIALVVPVLCFVPHWMGLKKWTLLVKPIYILGIVFLAILLIPMSWGLYQQYDMHPGKIIHGVAIQSGLKFYYWTQSFGRYTGENSFHEMGYFTFLLENMFWSFLPWIFVFLWALGDKIMSFFKDGFFGPTNERISFFGFVLTYLILSRSQAQLPHYIFIVFPLAAIITAAHWQDVLWGQQTFSIRLKLFSKFHLFLFVILCIVLGGILFIPFGMAPLWLILVMIISIVFSLILFISKINLGVKWFIASVVIMLTINTALNFHFYPHLLKYQWGNQLANVIKKEGWNKNKLVVYDLPNYDSFHFYGQHIFKSVENKDLLQGGDWVVTSTDMSKKLLQEFPRSVIKYKGERFHVTMLTLPFLNPNTRPNEVYTFEVIELIN